MGSRYVRVVPEMSHMNPRYHLINWAAVVFSWCNQDFPKHALIHNRHGSASPVLSPDIS